MNFHAAEQRPESWRSGACAHYTERNGRERRGHENETIRRWKIPPKTCSQNCFINIDSGRQGIVLLTCLKHIRRHPPPPKKIRRALLKYAQRHTIRHVEHKHIQTNRSETTINVRPEYIRTIFFRVRYHVTFRPLKFSIARLGASESLNTATAPSYWRTKWNNFSVLDTSCTE